MRFHGPDFRSYTKALMKAGPGRLDEFKQWLVSRPPEIQALVRENPPGSWTLVNGKVAFVMSYLQTEGDGTGYMFTHTDPAEDYEKAVSGRFFVCADCLAGKEHSH